MKAKSKIIFLVVLFITLMGNMSVAQDLTDQFLKKPEKLNWFFVTITMEKNKETKMNEYKIRPSGGFYSGSTEKFKKALWGNRTSLRLALGPYWNKETAKKAQRIYSQISKKVLKTSVLSAITDDQVHWYYLKVKKKRVGYKLEATAARVATGTVQEFYDALNEGLVQEMLAVGPFNDYTEAEDSKALYRAQEDIRSRR